MIEKAKNVIGVFSKLNEIIDYLNNGGGGGSGELTHFIGYLSEEHPFNTSPSVNPRFTPIENVGFDYSTGDIKILREGFYVLYANLTIGGTTNPVTKTLGVTINGLPIKERSGYSVGSVNLDTMIPVNLKEGDVIGTIYAEEEGVGGYPPVSTPISGQVSINFVR